MNNNKTTQQDTQRVETRTLVPNNQERATASTPTTLKSGDSISHYEDNMRVATISDSTRMLLIALGKLNDVYNIIIQWCNEFDSTSSEKILNAYIDKPNGDYFDGIHKLLEISIQEARGDKNSTEI